MQKKPAPDLYLKALSLLNLLPCDVIVIEDSERGLLAAQAAECEAIWIKTPFNLRFKTTAPYVAELNHLELLNVLKS